MNSTVKNIKLVVAISMLVGAVVWLGLDVYWLVDGQARYDREIESHWVLADRASTLPQKSFYIDKFVSALESQGFAGKHNAILYPTPSNSFDANIEALKSFQQRLQEIQGMDVKSFEYQTAIQQITAQEQGEAREMLDVFKGVWWKANYTLTWDWIFVLNILCLMCVTLIGWIGVYNLLEDDKWWGY